MAQPDRVTEREQLKRLLVAESDLHRAILGSEWRRLTSWGKAAQHWKDTLSGRATGPAWWALGSAAVGLLLTRRWRTWVRWAPTAWTLWRWWRRHKWK